MNRIEKIVYDWVKSTPWIKYILRNIYQNLFDILPRKKEYMLNQLEYREGYFYGFHDSSPFSRDESKVLAHHTKLPVRMPLISEAVGVGYFEFKEGLLGKYVKIGDSYSWNYHKGCRLQWLSESELIYNTSYDGRLVSVIYDLLQKTERTINFPIDSVSSDAYYASSFSYERLEELMPGYGYKGYTDDGYIKEGVPCDTGIFLIDLRQNKRKLLVSLFELANHLQSIDDKEHYRHYVTHSEFSKDNRYLSFLHRWIGKDTRKRTSRLIIYDLVKRVFFELPTEGMVSHYVWNSKNQIVAYCNIDGIDCHTLFDIDGSIRHEKIIAKSINSDGHQSFVTNSVLVTDTYPDRYRMAQLYKVDVERMKTTILASVYSPKKFQTRDFKSHIACDLHPRVSQSGKYVCFDSPRTGKRALCIMKL